MSWEIINTGLASASMLMEKDRLLLEELPGRTKPLLHLYQFAGNSATYGHFVDPYQFFSSECAREQELDLARRPTGGGVIFHLWDLAFSVLVPACSSLFSHNTMENYATVNRPVLRAVQTFLQKKEGELSPQDGEILGPGCAHFCMAKPTKYDVVLEGKKIAGAAQRKTRHGFLHQGSISLLMPSEAWVASVLKPGLNVLDGMLTYTFPLLGKQATLQDLEEGRKRIQELLLQEITKI